MNSLILCAGEVTKNPYYFSITDTKVYSIEELCYYLFNNIYVISPELIGDNLVQWIDKEIKMPQLAEKIKLLIIKGKNLKDMVTTIMCSSDYYNEQEIRNLIDTIDRIEGMPDIRRRKIKADNLLKYNNYSMAGREYESILASKEARELEDEYYGNILHNLGIVKIHTSSFMTAASCFKEAYKKNNNIESLKQYFYTLKLEKNDELFEKEMTNYSVKPEFIADIAATFIERSEEAKEQARYVMLERLDYLKNEGRINEYYDSIDRLILQWKRDYKTKRASLSFNN